MSDKKFLHPGTPFHHPTVAEIHPTTEGVASIELTPPHPPREETPIYRRAHHFLIVEKDSSCLVCGLRQSTLHNNTIGAKAMETHHYPIERSLADACDWRKVHEKLWPQVMDEESLMQIIDSPANLIVLCDIHHRSLEHGIHHLATQDWAILPYLRDGYVLTTDKAHEAEAIAKDRSVLEGEAHE